MYFDKNQLGAENFIQTWLTKYEEVVTKDVFNSSKSKTKLKSIKVKQNLFIESNDTVFFARGILELIPKTEYHILYLTPSSIIKPQVNTDDIKHSLPSFDLRQDQIIAVNKCLLLQRGVIQLPTAVGKSAIIASTAKWLLKFNPQMKILAIAPSLSTVENINNTFLENNLDSQTFLADTTDLSSPITTALVQTICTAEHPELLQQIQGVFYDECLPKSSSILLPDGSHRTIEEIYNDDSIQAVLSYDIENQCYVPKVITRKIKQDYNDRFCKVYYYDQIDGSLKGITCTPNHKIYTKERGYVEAQDLVPSDLLKIDYPYLRYSRFSGDLYMPVARVSMNRGSLSKVKYNLEVEDTHNYFADNVLVSNCHHLQCDTWNTVNSLLPNAEYSLGFSALAIDKQYIYETDFRNLDYTSALIMGNSGKVLLHMDPSYYIEKGIIALPVVFRLNNYITFPEEINESNWSEVIKYGLKNEHRTQQVIQSATIFSNYHRKVLILVFEKEYAHQLANRLLLENPNKKIGLSFGSKKGFIYSYEDDQILITKENSLKVIEQFSNGQIDILLGTSHLDEGVDVKHLDVLILANGGKKDRRIIQRLGRVLRKSKLGKYAYIVDFMDHGSKVLSRQSNSRLKLYTEEIGIPLTNIYTDTTIEEIQKEFTTLEFNE